MKKRIISLIFALVFCFSMAIPAFAVIDESANPWDDLELAEGEVIVYQDNEVTITQSGAPLSADTVAREGIPYGSAYTYGGSGEFYINVPYKGSLKTTFELNDCADGVVVSIQLKSPCGTFHPSGAPVFLSSGDTKRVINLYCAISGRWTATYNATARSRIMCWIYEA